MPWQLWVAVVVGVVLALYIVLRVAFVYFFCGGNDTGNYYSD